MIKTFRTDIKRKKLSELLQDFAKKAKDWGVKREYGIGSSIAEAEYEYEKSQDVLVRYLNRVLK